MEFDFLEFHGSTLDKRPKVIQRLVIHEGVIHLFVKTRTMIRIRHFNLKYKAERAEKARERKNRQFAEAFSSSK